MIMVDQSGFITFVNRETERLFGYSREELNGQLIEVLVPEKFRSAHPIYRGQFFKNPVSRAMGMGRELFGLRKDGSEVPIEIGLNPMEAEGEKFVLVSIIDITERKKNEALIAAREAALESSKMKSQFLANMSHEIRTPINGILGMTRLILDTDLSQTQKEYAQIIHDSAESLLSVISDILDFSKIETGKISFEIIEFDLNYLLENLVQIYTNSAQRKNISLQFHGPEISTLYMSDPIRVRQILNNLIQNAVKFTFSGNINIECRILSECEEKTRFRFEVSDTGIGISKKSIDRLFQVFTQGDESTTRKFGGTGLGLAISKRLVDLFGGTIGVNSVLNKGSTFWFEIEMIKGSPIAFHSFKEKNNQKIESVWDEQRFKILAAEDNQVNQIVIKKVLEKLGFIVDVAGNGFEVMTALKKDQYDLILMDCQMPEMDGYETTKNIRKNKDIKISKIPIIAMTANVIKGDKEKCLDVGMNDYISKPIQIDHLRDILRRWLPAN
ncbi:MAG: response regulator [Bdellovibrionales bacterium]|nr:response regulator [Bdellovibrionales bacterium]